MWPLVPVPTPRSALLYGHGHLLYTKPCPGLSVTMALPVPLYLSFPTYKMGAAVPIP